MFIAGCHHSDEHACDHDACRQHYHYHTAATGQEILILVIKPAPGGRITLKPAPGDETTGRWQDYNNTTTRWQDHNKTITRWQENNKTVTRQQDLYFAQLSLGGRSTEKPLFPAWWQLCFVLFLTLFLHVCVVYRNDKPILMYAILLLCDWSKLLKNNMYTLK